ncbi:MAG: histidine--tRNA ligase [Candidatus Saccharibacteria bacterium]|nr:histidine--tRNA ligase [Candidatus Saccharibacteria bacterium]
MKKMNTTPISGMMELLPSDQIIFNEIKSRISRAYHLNGFRPIEPPTIERNEILFAKAGGDTEKQIYRVIKTEEAAEDSDQSLRFDHTVPLARYIIEHESTLQFPFRVTQIGKNFRGERAQKGRYREFYQCDVDVIGRNELPISYDAEVIATLYSALSSFLKPSLLIRVSNRKILSGLITMLDLGDKSEAIYSIIDHAEKVPPVKTQQFLMEEIGDDDEVDFFVEFMSTSGNQSEVKAVLEAILREVKEYVPAEIQGTERFVAGEQMYLAGLSELLMVADLLEKRGLAGKFVLDMLIVRGLDYYTGTVFETILPEYKEIGSVCSGGRYENLCEFYSDQKFPGVGGSIGLTRLFYILKENNLLPEVSGLIDYAIIPMSENEYEFAFGLSERLKGEGSACDVILTDKKLGDKLSLASKIAAFGIVIGEREVAENKVSIKNFADGSETELSL